MALGLRSETAGLVRLAERDLAALWQLVLGGAPAPEVLNDILPALVTNYGEMGAAVAADWYDGVREARGVRGSFRAIPLGASDRHVSGLIGHALLTATNDAALQTLILGGVQRRIADHVRLTVANSSVADPAAEGWRRIGDGDPCDWCKPYLDGEVHYIEGYDFDAHDWCNCEVESVWG